MILGTKMTLVLAAAALALLAASAFASDQYTTKSGDRADADTVYVRMTTSKGEIILALNQDKAPISVENFLAYAENDFYDGTIFHRVIEDFMIQGGGFDSDMNRKQTRDPIENEWRNGLSNERGTIAMARLGNQPDSATSQFFINLKDNPFLDQPRDGAGYAVFGEVVEGMETVDQIGGVDTTSKRGMRDVPMNEVVIEGVEIIGWE
jgi:cyclophilin family peptidyl-prolyl cis-trans isomerase